MKLSKMRKFMAMILTLMLFVLPEAAFAEGRTYTVAPGDTMWKIAVRYQIGYSELLKANPQVKNPSAIYVGEKIYIPSVDDLATVEQQVVDLVNRNRVSAGLAPLSVNWQLARVARYKSQDMINKGYFGHQSPTYGSPFQMMESFGISFTAAGENIAYGQRSAQEVMNAWMNSSGHRANIMSPIYTQIGVGVAKASNGTFYWTQEFIKSY